MESKRSILAIDDNIMQLDMFKKMLEANYTVQIVSSASEALNFLNTSTNKADIILLDIEMPNISGFDFLYDIRKIPSYMTTPIIIVSGKKDPDFYETAKSSSAFDVLSKPVKQDLLVETIEKAIASKA
ncbi:MAG: response regulator [Treponema sp.]|nr:response regulator [Treponema sp.]